MSTQVEQLSDTLVGTHPKAVADPLLLPGTKFFFDFSNPLCHPGGVITPGVKTSGTVFNDLVSGIDGVLTNTTGTVAVNSSGSINMTTSTANDYITIGTNAQFDMSAAEYRRLLVYWFKLPASGFTTGAALPIIWSNSSNYNQAQTAIWLNGAATDGRRFIGTNGRGSATGHVSGNTMQDAALNTPIQLGNLWEPGVGAKMYMNSALEQATANAETQIVATGAIPFRIAGHVKQTVLAAALYNLDEMDAAFEAQGWDPEYRYDVPGLIERDYLFRTGQLADAPRTAFT